MPILIYKAENCYPQRTGAIAFDGIELTPGVNHLSDADIAKLQAHPDFGAYQERKALAVKETEPDKEVQTVPLSEVPKDLSAYNVGEADDIVDNTHDVDVLNRWLIGETRSTVRRNITQRKKAIESGVI
jgi:hypothetical protein